MADGQNPLSGAHMDINYHLTGLILRNNTWHTSEHGLGRASKNNTHLSNDNQITEVRHTFLRRRDNGILTQRGGHPLHLVRVCHGIISVQSVPINNHGHATLGKQRLPVVYLHPGQWPQQGHQYPHDNKSRFLHITRNISCLPHTKTKWHRITKAEPKKMKMRTQTFLPLATVLK